MTLSKYLLIIHSDRGAAMRSKTVGQLLIDFDLILELRLLVCCLTPRSNGLQTILLSPFAIRGPSRRGRGLGSLAIKEIIHV